MKVAITGASGLIGSALVASLEASGDTVVRFVRRAAVAGRGEASWDPGRGTIDTSSLAGADAVVHLAGEGIGDKRWSDAQKARIFASRVDGTALVSSAVASLPEPRPVLVSASAVGYYGLRGDEVLTEASSGGSGFLADVVKAWEGATAAASAGGVRVVHLRTGIVLARRGALGRMLPFFRLGLGGPLGSGRQWWSWIALDDIVGLIRHAITTVSVGGPMNATSPHPATNGDVARALGRVLHRPALLPVPAFALSLLLGRELTHEMVMAGQRALPEVALGSGYAFRYPQLEPALRAAVGRG